MATAGRLADVGPAFSVTKRQFRLELEARIGRLAGLDADVDAVWRSPRTVERIRSYMKSLPSRWLTGPGTRPRRRPARPGQARTGRGLGSVYLQRGTIDRGLFISVAIFVLIYIVVGVFPVHRLVPTNGTVSLGRYLALSPALLVMVLSNGLQEESLFRGLFLQKYNRFFGIHTSNLLQALIFAAAHAGVTYTPFVLVFIALIIFPVGLIAGYLMRTTKGMLAPTIFHAGIDIPLYLAFLTYAS